MKKIKMPALEQTALFEINRLIELWESMAKSARQMADENEGRTYTIGYGYGTADAFENAAKQLKSLNFFARKRSLGFIARHSSVRLPNDQVLSRGL